jgi:hypothetical protein
MGTRAYVDERRHEFAGDTPTTNASTTGSRGRLAHREQRERRRARAVVGQPRLATFSSTTKQSTKQQGRRHSTAHSRQARSLALGRERVVPAEVVAVVVDHVALLRPAHGRVLPRREPGPRGGRRHGPARGRGAGGAAGDDEAVEARDEGLVAVVGAVAAVVGGPVGGVPDGAVDPHGAVREGELGAALVAADGHVVHEEGDGVGVPQDGVGVVGRRGVEPEVEPHLTPHDAPVAAAAHVHVRLQRVGLPRDGAQELHVDLVVETRVRLVVGELQMINVLYVGRISLAPDRPQCKHPGVSVCIAYIEGGVGAGGVSGGELDASGEVAVPVRVLRLETAPCMQGLCQHQDHNEQCKVRNSASNGPHGPHHRHGHGHDQSSAPQPTATTIFFSFYTPRYQ